MSVDQPRKAYNPISDYGIIDNRRSAALFGVDRSIDRCCSRRFEAPCAFPAILDAEKGGRCER